MTEPIVIKQFVHLSSKDSVNPKQPNQLRIAFNNPELSNNGATSKSLIYLTPLYLTMNYIATNISDFYYKNNKFSIKIGSGAETVLTIPDGNYSANDIIQQFKTLTATVNWSGSIAVNFSNSIKDAYDVFTFNLSQPAGVTGSPSLILNFKPVVAGIQYDSTDIFGVNTDTVTFPFPTAAGIKFICPTSADLQPVEIIRVHSNVAKQSLVMKQQTNSSGTTKVLTNSDILFSFPSNNVQNNEIFQFVPHDYSIYRQEIIGNMDIFTLYFTNDEDILIPLNENAEINICFVLEKHIYPITANERLQGIKNYVQYQ